MAPKAEAIFNNPEQLNKFKNEDKMVKKILIVQEQVIATKYIKA